MRSFLVPVTAVTRLFDTCIALEPALTNVPVSGELLQHATIPFLESRVGEVRGERFHPFVADYGHRELF